MEQWETLIEGYPDPPDLRYFAKVVQAAGVILKEDLAPFEVEWITETLLFKPVELLDTISSKRNDDAWLKSIGDAFKLLAEVVERNEDSLEKHYEDIVTRCLLSYDAQTRKQALLCLTAIARKSASGARDPKRHIADLEQLATCRAPMALLVGMICEYHPEVVTEDVNKIWRIYLNLLESNKNTTTITSSVLQGLLGLFKHFGCDLPTAELNSFYDKMVADFLQLPRCIDVCLSILELHGHLFRERLAKDVRTRKYLWLALQDSRNSAARSLRSVYTEICEVLDKKKLQELITSELLPQTQSFRTQVKYTALRILTHVRTKYNITIADDEHTDTQTLEFELRNDNVSYDTAEAVAWCIESNLPNSDKLLQTGILFYSNIPATKRKEIVVYGILNAPAELRTATVTFLITESCEDMDKFNPVWTDMFDTNKGQDTLVMDKSRLVFEDFMSYVVFVLEGFLEDDVLEKPPERLTTLLDLTTNILTIIPPENYTSSLCSALLPLLMDHTRLYGLTAAVLACMRIALEHANDAREDFWQFQYEYIRIDRCRDEALLCESCLMLLDGPAVNRQVVTALQILFSRNDVEPKTLSKALLKLEDALVMEENDSDEQNINNRYLINTIIHQVEKLRDRKDMTGKDGRILHRDVLLFLGKYGCKSEVNNNMDSPENTLLVKLKDGLVFNLPNPHDGTTYKINLQSILQLALVHEDPSALQTLLVIICANYPGEKQAFLNALQENGKNWEAVASTVNQPVEVCQESFESLQKELKKEETKYKKLVMGTVSTRKTPTLQCALTCVTRALSNAHARGGSVDARALQTAVLMCDSVPCVQQMLMYISEEKSPGVRKMLSDALEALLTQDPGSDLTESLVNTVAEHSAIMMNSIHSTTKRAGLDIIETLITALKENNSLAKKLLSDILVLITKTNEIGSEIPFEQASSTFLEKIELFEDENVENLIEKLMETLLQNGRRALHKMADELEEKAFKNTVKMTIEFIKKIFDYKYEYSSKIIDIFFKVIEKLNSNDFECLYVLAEVRRIFDLNSVLCRNVLSNRDSFVLNILFSLDVETICMEVVWRFLEEYAEILLELQYEKILPLLDNIIVSLSPLQVKYLHRNIRSCLSVYEKILKNIPNKLIKSFEIWCMKLPIQEITQRISKEHFTHEDAIQIHAFKIMLNIFKLTDMSILADMSSHIQRWPKILLKLYSSEYITNYLRSKMTYLTDLLSISIKFSTLTDLKRIMLEGHNLHGVSNEKIGIQFCRYFMNVYFDILIEKPFILMDEDMKPCCILLNDIVKYALRKKCKDIQYEHVLELVNELWPTYEFETTFIQKHSLLLDLVNLPKKLNPESKPMQWAVGAVCSKDTSREDKARLVGVLPGGKAYSAAYRAFACTLPIRFSEISNGAHAASLRALLDALATTGDLQIMEIVMSLAGGDDTKGWWDDAIESCMASLAQRGDLDMYKAVYRRCWEGLSLGVCRRVMMPLLRYSTSQFCERFYSTISKELLSKIHEYREATKHTAFKKSLVDYTKAFYLLQVAFEKLPPTSLESPSSLLYSGIETQQSWHMVRQTCKDCVTLRNKVTLIDDRVDMKLYYRQFQCANFNCLCAGLCRQRTTSVEVFKKYVFDAHTWTSLVDSDHTPSLKLRSQWNKRTVHHPTTVETSSRMTSLTAGTSRTRLFLRTLSECPFQYDLTVDTDATEVTTQELVLTENALNSDECAAALTSVTCYVATTLQDVAWRDKLTDTLTDNTSPYVKLLVAQIICNCKEELKPHASALRPALLAMICSTVCVENEKKLLNQLHVDVLDTIIFWQDDSPQPSSQLNTTFECLLTTCLENRQRDGIFRSLLDTAGKLLEIYGTVVNVAWNVFAPYLHDTEASRTLQLLKLLTKYKVYLPELVPTLLPRVEARHQLADLAKLLGLALTVHSDHGMIAKFRRVLDQTRRSNATADYVKMLYYVQNEFSGCCDEANFRTITDLVRKIVGPEKPKCIQILTSYVTHHPESEYIPDMYESIDICELLMGEQSVEAMALVKAGLGRMTEVLKRRVVMQVAGYCEHSLAKVRRAACEVMLKAFEEHFKPNSSPSPKRPRTNTTPILSALDSTCVYTTTILSCLGRGVIDQPDLAESVKNYLSTDDVAIRFTECFSIAVYLSSVKANKSRDTSECAYVLLDMLFSHLRDQEMFRRLKLRDEPLVKREISSTPSKLLTMSRTYQGTFRRSTLTGKPTNKQLQDLNTTDIDIQISLDDILGSLLQFAKVTPEAAQALCVQFTKSLLLVPGRGFEVGPVLAKQLTALLSNASPLVLEMCRLFVDDSCKVNGFEEALENLKTTTIGTEGELHTKLLYEEMKLRCNGYEQFVLGSYGDFYGDYDADMEEQSFCMEELTSVFGKLSNWDTMTIQEKKRLQYSGIPPLWTDGDTFRACIAEPDYKGRGWFAKMLSAYRQDDKQNAMKWLREVDKWPRRAFDISAVSEAIEWLLRDESSEKPYICDIQPSHCLAEWAARLMIRSAYINSLESDVDSVEVLSRSHELSWCERANEAGLSFLVLDCVKRNAASNLCQSETLPWLRQKLLARRAMGLERNDEDILKKALTDAETYTARFLEDANPCSILGMKKLILQLNQDLKQPIATSNLVSMVGELDKQIEKADGKLTQANRQTLSVIYEMMMMQYVEEMKKSSPSNSITLNMTNILSRAVSLGLTNCDGLLAVVLNTLEHRNEITLTENTARMLLDIIKLRITTLDDFTLNQLRSLAHMFPSRLRSEYAFMRERDDSSLIKYKKCFQLICDAEYMLLHYCDMLQKALGNDNANEWKEVFNRMKEKMFENPYRGSDYQLLTKHKNKLYDIFDYESTEPYKTKAQRILKSIVLELRQRKAQNVLRLSQLCPALLRDDDVDRDTCLAKLLGLKNGVTVVRFDEQVSVFTDSIRRPTVIRVLLSTGAARRYLHKSGEPLQVDSAAQNVLAAAASVWQRQYVVGYKVTPLSEDCGLIEFLEDHERLRSLMSSSYDLDSVLDTVLRPADHELILAPIQASLNQHHQLCDKIPAHALRTSVQSHCASVEDFIVKKRRFTDTVAAMTVLGWILGLGDRHLQNILYSIQDGGVCCVDWAALFQYGAGELPPARLTRNIVAVCDGEVLESRLQFLLGALRESSGLFLAVIKTSFRWMGTDFNDKFSYIKSILHGTSLSYNITRQALEGDNEYKYKSKYTQLLDNVFQDWQMKDVYSVEEQVSCLLRQCTDPQILSVTRSGWEPWL